MLVGLFITLTSDFQVDDRIAGNARFAGGLERPARVITGVRMRHVPYQKSALLDRILFACREEKKKKKVLFFQTQ